MVYTNTFQTISKLFKKIKNWTLCNVLLFMCVIKFQLNYLSFPSSLYITSVCVLTRCTYMYVRLDILVSNIMFSL